MAPTVELSFVRVADVSDAALARVRAALSAGDEARAARYLFDQHRREFVLTRALEAAVLAPLVEGPLVLTRTEAGKPELAPPSELQFNLTNTVELVCCAVTRGRPIGVDAEPLARAADILGLAETIFTPAERAALAALPEAPRKRAAVALWTLKEAYMKARGLGLALAPEALEFDWLVGPGGAPGPRLVSRLVSVSPDDAPLSRWSFETRELEAHLVTVCVEGAIGALAQRRIAIS